MNAGITPGAPFDFDDPRCRLVWTVPVAVALWFGVLVIFSHFLERTAPPPPELAPVQARIVELPPAGFSSGAAAPAKPAPIAKLHPVARPHPRAHPPVVNHRRALPKPIAPPAPPAPNGTAKQEEAPSTAAAHAKNTGPAGISGGTGNGSGAGLGSDSAGARAIFAPTPAIPDDLREQPFDAVAVAHFKVAPDGTVEVALIQPTDNPELNGILIDTLKQWRFFPAMRSGVAVRSEFDLRIPISVR
jgi:protein TonB